MNNTENDDTIAVDYNPEKAMKHKKFKKRFIILAIIILLTGIFLAYYVGYIGENYELRTGFFGAEMSDVKVQTERDGVVEMTDELLAVGAASRNEYSNLDHDERKSVYP